MKETDPLRSVPDDELLHRLSELASESRRVEADLVAHIGEVERRRLYAREATPSMFVYCRERLRLSEAEAYMRIRVARAARRHPLLLDMLRDGRLHLSGIVRLLPVLTRDNRDWLLARATDASKSRILELVAELAPRPDAPDRIRKLPEPTRVPGQPTVFSAPPGSEDTAGAGPAAGGDRTSGGGRPLEVQHERLEPSRQLCPDTVRSDLPGRVDLTAPGNGHERSETEILCESASGGVLNVAPGQRAVVEPLSPGRYRVQFTASAELRNKLERLQALMRFHLPGGDLAQVIEAAVSEKLQRLEARRFGKTSAARKSLAETDTASVSRHVPAAVRRAVHGRDGDQCAFRDAQGRRCSQRDRLEFHHRWPFGRGGDYQPRNIALLCHAHNQLMARIDYGLLATPRRGA